ncbi:MAG TPA: FtsK/SpoIIIE domain-containing protein [Acidimicrobiales bacterium]|nr:FtsK/SpoIIIE domain-containing protein [Acidimicrobiales bacterium]
MEPAEAPAELVSQPVQLAALLAHVRDAYQKHLVATASSRASLDRRLQQSRLQAETDSKRFAPDPSLLDRYSRAWNEFGEAGGPTELTVVTPTSLAQAEATWSRCTERCERVLTDYRRARQEYDEGRRRLFGKPKNEPRIRDQFRFDLWTMKAVLDALPLLREEHCAAVTAAVTQDLTATFHAEVSQRDAQFNQLLETSRPDISLAIQLFGVLGQSWPKVHGDGPTPLASREHALVRLGRFVSVAPQAVPVEVPCVIEFPSQRGLAVEAPASRRDEALSLARSVVLRSLMSMPPGQLHMSIFDPVAMGQSFADFLHLGDFDERLMDSKPRTSAREIEGRLEGHIAHLETVIGKYLRGQFSTIRDYNLQADEMAEPYRLLVVCDYPTQFTDRASEMLLSLLENGARCGIHVIVLYDPELGSSGRVPLGRLLADADRISWSGQNIHVELAPGPLAVDVVPDHCPEIGFTTDGAPATDAAHFLVRLGTAAREAEDRVVELGQTFQLLKRSMAAGSASHLPVLGPDAVPVKVEQPATWWSGDSSSGATAILGRAGALTVAPLYFSSTDIAGGALMVGLPRSGKTTSLHASILSLAILYSPEELELYLIDAKHGVEFNAYRDLPHARMVAINSEREFAVAVLSSLDSEIARRAALMKERAPGRTNLRDYRSATGERMPRIVVIIDEFHEVFEEDDRLGQQAFAAFSNIVRQGPFAGVHLVLASQTLSSMPAMDRNTLTLLPARVAFACNDSDGQVVMGDSNPDVRFLSRAGEGLLNPNRGDPTHNLKFQGTFVSPEHREQLVRQIVAKAAATGWDRHPRVFDGDSLADRGAVAPEVFARAADRPHRVRFVAGEPLTLEERLALTLRRATGHNVLLIGPADDDGVPGPGLLGVLHSLLIAAAHQAPDTHVIDFINDEGEAASHRGDTRIPLSELCQSLGLHVHRRRALDTTLDETAQIVAERIALEDYRSVGRLLVLFGVQRATGLDPESFEDDTPAAALQSILRDGPEVGVHTVIVADTLAGLQRRLGPSALEHVGLRLAGRLGSDQDRQQVLDEYRSVDLRAHQLALFDRERDSRLKFRPYGPVTHDWLTVTSLDAQFQRRSAS